MNECYMAVHKETGHYFGGKNGVHIGYNKISYLKSAMTHAKVNKDDYIFVKLSFDERLAPEFTWMLDKE